MQIVFNPQSISPSVLAVGNFDGLHCGHKKILQTARRVALEQNLPVAVLSFEPHPRKFFQAEKAPKRISLLREKLRLFEQNGVDVCYIQRFDSKFSQLSAENFVNNFLQSCIVLTGQDFCFGKNRGGNVALLQEKLGQNFILVEPQFLAGEVVSSSKIRAEIMVGNVVTAAELLGHNFAIEARVQHGDKRGRGLGFATANLRLQQSQLVPQYGVYAVKTQFGEAVANFGVRPSVAKKIELLEVHLFDFAGDLYGQKLRVEFCKFLREEKFFNSLLDLQNQIKLDVISAKIFFDNE